MSHPSTVAKRTLRYAASVPERLVRATAAALGGLLHESAQVLLPRFVRGSRLYEATAKNALRIAVEAVGGVEPVEPPEISVADVTKRKAGGNAVELGSIAAFGFSPLWLLAAASDVLHGSRVYLAEFVAELKRAGVVGEDRDIGSVDELLEALESASGRTAGLIDLPPLELTELRATLAELRRDAAGLPGLDQLAALYRGLRAQAARERRPLLEVSVGMGLAFLTSARTVADRHLAVPYREDWAPLRHEGFGAYARRVSVPYARAAGGHFDPARPSWTERLILRLARVR
ncbi:MAG: hypothetical protein ACRDPP_09970 [Gaiellaceae bacterium]